jgi:FixJ family two-component response regulator
MPSDSHLPAEPLEPRSSAYQHPQHALRSNRAIAARLFVTERTVEAHVTQIFQKLRLPESPDQHRRVLAVLTFLRT